MLSKNIYKFVEKCFCIEDGRNAGGVRGQLYFVRKTKIRFQFVEVHSVAYLMFT